MAQPKLDKGKYGYFDVEAREYVVTRPDTPLPWINYIGCEKYCGLISQTAGGYSFFSDPRQMRITRYRYNNAPLDMGGRYIYIRDNYDGHYWSASWMPVRNPLAADFEGKPASERPSDLYDYECRHGMGYTQISSKMRGIKTKTTFTVPLGENLELWMVEIENTNDQPRDLTLFSFVEFCLWDAHNDMTDYQYNLNIGRCDVKDDIIYHLSRYRVDKSYFAYFGTSGKVASTDTQRIEFLGKYRGMDAPQAVIKGECSNSIARDWSPVGAHCIKVPLKPREKKTITFVLGFSEDKREPKKIMKKYGEPEAVHAALSKLKAMWEGSLSKFQAYTPDAETNLMVNVWNQYQCRTTFNWSRSASYFESGIGRGMGFRDGNQDTMGFVHQIPAEVRTRLIDLASNQFAEGCAYHQYSPLTKKGAGAGYGDDHIWLVLAVASYIKETGDKEFLSEKVPFAVRTAAAVVGSGEAQAIAGADKKTAGKGAGGRSGGSKSGAGKGKIETGTVYDHCARAVEYSFKNVGPHNLPLIGFADWNDCLNLNQGKNNAESVMVAQQAVAACKEMMELARVSGKKSDISKYQKLADKMTAQINKVAWDGKWYMRAFDDNKKPVGSSKNEAGKIFLETQGWGVISGVADAKKAKQCLDSVNEYLATKHGILILQPAFDEFDHTLGSITVYPPGLKENAAIFCHPNPWIMIAECIAGRGDQAYEYYKAIQPAARNKIADTHRLEPYVYCQMIAGKDHSAFGQAKNSWLTGSAAWNFIAASQWILGVRADYDGLRVDPCIPKGWGTFSVRRVFRGATYMITVKNPNHVSKGVRLMKVDGRAYAPGANLIPAFTDKKEHQVEVTLG